MGCVELDFGLDGQADSVLANMNLTLMMCKMAEPSNQRQQKPNEDLENPAQHTG